MRQVSYPDPAVHAPDPGCCRRCAGTRCRGRAQQVAAIVFLPHGHASPRRARARASPWRARGRARPQDVGGRRRARVARSIPHGRRQWHTARRHRGKGAQSRPGRSTTRRRSERRESGRTSARSTTHRNDVRHPPAREQRRRRGRMRLERPSTDGVRRRPRGSTGHPRRAATVTLNIRAVGAGVVRTRLLGRRSTPVERAHARARRAHAGDAPPDARSPTPGRRARVAAVRQEAHRYWSRRAASARAQPRGRGPGGLRVGACAKNQQGVWGLCVCADVCLGWTEVLLSS